MSLTRRVVLKSIVVCAAVFAGTLAVYTVGLPAVGVLAGAVALWYRQLDDIVGQDVIAWPEHGHQPVLQHQHRICRLQQ